MTEYDPLLTAVSRAKELGTRLERDRIIELLKALPRYDTIEEAQGSPVEVSAEGWLLDFYEVIAAIGGEKA